HDASVDRSDQSLTDPGIIDDALLRNAQRRDAAYMRLDLAHLLAAEHAQTFQSILAAPLVQIVQTGQLLRAGGDHKLAADLVRNRVLLAEFNHLADTAHRESCFGRARFVIKAAVQHAAVVTGLMPAGGILLFEDSDGGAGKALAQAKSSRQANDPTADNQR